MTATHTELLTFVNGDALSLLVPPFDRDRNRGWRARSTLAYALRGNAYELRVRLS
jgi:hypothetical protein